METMGSHYWFLYGDRNGRETLQSGAETYGIVFSTTQPASSQEHTLIHSERRTRLHISHQESLDLISHKSIYHFISPESHCMLILSIIPLCICHHPHLFATPLNFQTAFCHLPGSGCCSVRGLQLYDNWSQTFGRPVPFYCTHGCNMLTLIGRKRAGNILLDVLDRADAGRCAFIAKDNEELCCLTDEMCITVEL